MKTITFFGVLVFLATAGAVAKEPSWTGNYGNKQYLGGKAVFQLNILEENGQISVDFDAVYNDGHGCAPEGSGLAKPRDKETLKFSFTDTAGNSGTGTIKRVGTGVIVSVHATHVADSRCLVFYGANIALHPARPPR
jgi:hypothetical protein